MDIRRAEIESLKSVWNTIRARLEDECGRIYEQIRNYPTPIAACDQLFSYLLEEHTAILRELHRVDETADASLRLTDPTEPLEEFLRSTKYLDARLRQTIRSSLSAALSRSQP